MLSILKEKVQNLEELEKGTLGYFYIAHHALYFQPLNSKIYYPIAESQIKKIPYPLRVGRKNRCAILDADGHEVVVFRKELAKMASFTCQLINQFIKDFNNEK